MRAQWIVGRAGSTSGLLEITGILWRRLNVELASALDTDASTISILTTDWVVKLHFFFRTEFVEVLVPQLRQSWGLKFFSSHFAVNTHFSVGILKTGRIVRSKHDWCTCHAIFRDQGLVHLRDVSNFWMLHMDGVLGPACCVTRASSVLWIIHVYLILLVLNAAQV